VFVLSDASGKTVLCSLSALGTSVPCTGRRKNQTPACATRRFEVQNKKQKTKNKKQKTNKQVHITPAGHRTYSRSPPTKFAEHMHLREMLALSRSSFDLQAAAL
jgi:hypothetical protein